MPAAPPAPLSIPLPRGLVHEAKVAEAGPDGLVLELAAGARCAAKLSVLGYLPRPGDMVLCLTGEGDAAYVVGVLRALRAAPLTAPELRVLEAREPEPSAPELRAPEPPVVAEGGATAGLDAAGHIWVRDEHGRLVFEHAPGRSVVHAPDGDLVLAAPRGALRCEAADGVVLRGGREVQLDAPKVSVHATEAEITAEALTLSGGRLESAFERIVTVAETMESRVGRIVERARETYREVEELAQTRAERLRMVATKTVHVFGKRTLIKAEDDMKIKGDKIYLG